MGTYNDFSQLKKFKPIPPEQSRPAPPPEPTDHELANASSSTDYFSNLLGRGQEKKAVVAKPRRTTVVTPATIERVRAEQVEDARAAERAAAEAREAELTEEFQAQKDACESLAVDLAALRLELEAVQNEKSEVRSEVLRLEAENRSLAAERDSLARELAEERATPRRDTALLAELEERGKKITQLKALLAEAQRTSLSSSVLLEKPAAFSEKFSGEIREHVIEALAAATDAAEAGGRDRRARILEAVLGANPPSGELDHRREKVKQIIKDAGTTLDNAALAELENLGFRYISGNKHHKLEWAGIRFPLSKTPSDYRACLNSAAEICNRVF